MTLSIPTTIQAPVNRYYAITMNDMIVSEDERNIRKVYDTLKDAWSNNNSEVFASCFTIDCDFVNFHEQLPKNVNGKEQYERFLNQCDFVDTTLAADISKIKMVNSNTAIVHVKMGLLNRWQAKVASTHYAYQTHVLALENGSWQIASLHNNIKTRQGFFKRLLAAII